MNGRNDRRADRAVAAAFAVVLGISALWGEYDRSMDRNGDAADASVSEIEAGTPATATWSDSVQRGFVEDGVQRDSVEDGVPQEPVLPELDTTQKEVLTEILDCMKDQDLKSGAFVMEKKEEVLYTLFYDVMGGERYLYDGEGLGDSIEGKGLVLAMPGTVYYGTFKDGKPEGACTALQVVDLDAPRYDYSQGQWKDGKMDGQGHTGYCYYEGGPEGEVRDVCKSGTFSGDLMEGEVAYTTMNADDDISTWKLEVEKGAALLDESWIYREEQGEYQLMSADNDSHAYVMEKALAGQPVWKNLLVWE